jgi:hypothetical protein
MRQAAWRAPLCPLGTWSGPLRPHLPGRETLGTAHGAAPVPALAPGSWVTCRFTCAIASRSSSSWQQQRRGPCPCQQRHMAAAAAGPTTRPRPRCCMALTLHSHCRTTTTTTGTQPRSPQVVVMAMAMVGMGSAPTTRATLVGPRWWIGTGQGPPCGHGRPWTAGPMAHGTLGPPRMTRRQRRSPWWWCVSCARC